MKVSSIEFFAWFWVGLFVWELSSIEHGPDLAVEGLVIQVVDFDGLEVFFGVEIPLSDKESLSQYQLLNFGVVIIHYVIIGLSFLVAFEKLCNLFSSQFLSLTGRRFVVHHLVQLGEGFWIVLIWNYGRNVHFSKRASKSLRFLSTLLFEFIIFFYLLYPSKNSAILSFECFTPLKFFNMFDQFEKNKIFNLWAINQSINQSINHVLHSFFGNSMPLITGNKCSNMSLTLESSELSVTIEPSLLLKNTPPMIFLWPSSRLNSLNDNLVSMFIPVSLAMIWVNDFSHLAKTDSEIDLCSLLTSTATFLSIILSIPWNKIIYYLDDEVVQMLGVFFLIVNFLLQFFHQKTSQLLNELMSRLHLSYSLSVDDWGLLTEIIKIVTSLPWLFTKMKYLFCD